jgi:drug/metabolite transporter (DMT)-like permease
MSATPSLLSSSSSSSSARRFDPRLLMALLAVWIVWGSTYLAMRFAVEALPPLGMAGARFVVAGAVLFGILKMRGEPMPDARSWLVAAPVGVLLFLVGNGLVVVAEQSIPSSLAAMVCATTPLVVTGLEAARGNRPKAVDLAGIVLGFAGVVLLAVRSPLAHAGLRGSLIVLAPLGWALGSLLSRGQRGNGMSNAAAQMTCGGVSMLLASLVLGESMPATMPWRSVAAWGYLVVFGSVVGFTAYSWLLKNARPAVALSYAYVNPIVAALLGALIGGETLGWPVAIATALIASGVMAVVVRR